MPQVVVGHLTLEKLGVRSLSDARIVGFIVTVPGEASLDFERGTIPGEDVAHDGTR